MKRVPITVVLFAFLALPVLPLQSAEMKDSPGMTPEAGNTSAKQVHKGSGTVKGVDAKAGKVSLAHNPIPSLNWPAMTMDFKVRDRARLATLKPGQKIEFDLVEEKKGNYVISRIK